MSYKKNSQSHSKIKLYSWKEPYLEGTNITLHDWNDKTQTQHHFGTKHQKDTHNYRKHQELLVRYQTKLVKCFILDILNSFDDVDTQESILLKVIKTPSLLYRDGSSAKCMTKTAYQQNRLELSQVMVRLFNRLEEYYQYLSAGMADDGELKDLGLSLEIEGELKGLVEKIQSHYQCGPNVKSETQRSFRNSSNTTYSNAYTLISNNIILIYCAAQKQEKKLIKAHNTKLSKVLKKQNKSETKKQNKTLRSVSDYVRPKNVLDSVLKDVSLLYKEGIIPKASFFRNQKAIESLLLDLKGERQQILQNRIQSLKTSKYPRFQNKTIQYPKHQYPKSQNRAKSPFDQDWDLDQFASD